MPLPDETHSALALLKEVKVKVAGVSADDDLRHDQSITKDINTLIAVLENPVFNSIVNIQESLRELKRQVSNVNNFNYKLLKSLVDSF